MATNCFSPCPKPISSDFLPSLILRKSLYPSGGSVDAFQNVVEDAGGGLMDIRDMLLDEYLEELRIGDQMELGAGETAPTVSQRLPCRRTFAQIGIVNGESQTETEGAGDAF